MSYRSRSPPDYRQRRYSPSRPRSRSPPPPPRRYEDYPAPRQRYDDYPPRDRYDDRAARPAHREYSPERGGRYYRQDEFPPREGHVREDPWAEGTRVERRAEPERPAARSGMVADIEDHWENDRRRPVKAAEPQWERGREVEEAEQYNAPYSASEEKVHHQKGGKGQSEPSRDIIFLGLDQELSEVELIGYLRTEHKASIESAKIVRDKMTGQSRSFGFARFDTLEGAEEFIQNNHPAVLMPALYEHSVPKKVKIDFSSEPRAPSDRPNNTYHQKLEENEIHHSRPGHDGMRDIGPPGGGKRVLLLRGLETTSSANGIIRRLSEEIARLVGKTGREREAEGTICRVVVIIDRFSRTSWGYAFVELATTELASALLPFLLSPQHQPHGFLIAQKPVAASFANLAGFTPTPAGPLGGEFLIRASRNGGFGGETIDQPDGTWVSYWHDQGGAQTTIPKNSTVMSEGGEVKIDTSMRIFLGSLAGPFVPPSMATDQPLAPLTSGAISINPGLISFKTTGAKLKKKEEDALIPLSGKNVLGDEEEVDIIGKDTVLKSRTKGIHIIPPMTTSRKIAKDINKWNTKQTELAAPVKRNPQAAPSGMSEANVTLGHKRPPPVVVQPVASTSSIKSPIPDEFDYTDTSTLVSTGKVACLLCQRQFKTEEVLRKHVAQSDLHKARLFPSDLLIVGSTRAETDVLSLFILSVAKTTSNRTAYIKLKQQTNLLDTSTCQAGKTRKLAVVPSSEEPKYRDRAAERREVFNQSIIPLPEDTPATAQKRKFADGPAPPPPRPEPGLEPGKDESNVGNQLLAKMGWKAGTGLGKEGEGRVAPVLVQQFETRAGLGASKGHEAGAYTGPDGRKARALDMAKERYDSQSSSR